VQISVYAVDGAHSRLFCQNLCLLSKIFLDGKTLVWEVHEFFFYVLCEILPDGEEMVGYFSREKRSEVNHLACILTMPHKQRKGYGSLLIDFSYTLARLAEKPGSPERPLSDLGQVCVVVPVDTCVSVAKRWTYIAALYGNVRVIGYIGRSSSICSSNPTKARPA
jgi:histone acetyltransferase MYST1